jgi:hypothetical protein
MKLMKHEHSKPAPLVPVSKTWQPFWPLRRLQEDIDRLFEQPFGLWPAPSHGLLGKWGPAVDACMRTRTMSLLRSKSPA